jgi:hypothetical protein
VNETRPLISYLDTPIVVGDPDGRVAYVNPAFVERFEIEAGSVRERPVAELFEGGGREAVLGAIARVCQTGETVRFRLRERGQGWNAVASPIEAEDDRVGVLILLVQEDVANVRLLAFHREIQEPLEELGAALDELFEQTGGRRAERYRGLVENGMRALERVRKWSDELHAMLSGGRLAPRIGDLDPVRLVRHAAARVLGDFEADGVELDLLVPAQLPAARGDATALESVLVQLLRSRLRAAQPGASFTLAARLVGGGARPEVRISLVDPPGREGLAPSPALELESPLLRESIAASGGRVHTLADPVAGRVTALHIPTSRPRA